MTHTIQKRLAAKIAKRSAKKIFLDPARREEIKEAITRADVRSLIKDGAIRIIHARGISGGRIKKNKSQRTGGRRRGYGSRKGKQGARTPGKSVWIHKIRLQRKFLKSVKAKQTMESQVYKDLYRKSKGGFFRSLRHLKLYITEHGLMKK